MTNVGVARQPQAANDCRPNCNVTRKPVNRLLFTQSWWTCGSRVILWPEWRHRKYLRPEAGKWHACRLPRKRAFRRPLRLRSASVTQARLRYLITSRIPIKRFTQAAARLESKCNYSDSTSIIARADEQLTVVYVRQQKCDSFQALQFCVCINRHNSCRSADLAEKTMSLWSRFIIWYWQQKHKHIVALKFLVFNAVFLQKKASKKARNLLEVVEFGKKLLPKISNDTPGYKLCCYLIISARFMLVVYSVSTAVEVLLKPPWRDDDERVWYIGRQRRLLTPIPGAVNTPFCLRSYG